ncbi:hypothetical protein [Clostridium lundense]|uniref:hypothetical protein n=1 Tax=Clostridium lundense TaxID=319475 RepID=UPI000686367B|nr:hypothetical protein [Clostridium lundense]
MTPNWYLNYNCPYYYRSISNAQGRCGMQNMPMPNVSQQQMQQQPLQQQMQQAPQSTEFQSNFEVAPGSPTSLGIEYTQGYLKTQIGKRVKVTFLLGANIIQDRDGILTDVGISYIILRDLSADYSILADIYSIKFVNIYP